MTVCGFSFPSESPSPRKFLLASPLIMSSFLFIPSSSFINVLNVVMSSESIEQLENLAIFLRLAYKARYSSINTNAIGMIHFSSSLCYPYLYLSGCIICYGPKGLFLFMKREKRKNVFKICAKCFVINLYDLLHKL